MFKRISVTLLCITICINQAFALEEKSRVRVLLVRNLADQRTLEEAASLSLDLPQSQPIKDHTNQNSSQVNRPATFASLALHQSSSADPDTNNVSGQQRPTSRTEQDPWNELHLNRQKPSWLNVSSQFKINGDKVEEAPYIFPPEYLVRRAFDSPILMKTKKGILEGVRSIKFNKHLYTFLGIPYAKPPIGPLRFKAPEPASKWDGIYQATKWPPFCVQPTMTLTSQTSPVHILTYIMSEDCLYLNIWTPSLRFNKNQKRPVMVWLHGGAFQYGGISVDENDGSALALLGDVVVVTLNYRLSALGFLNANNPKNGPNNVGILDQQLALEWVQANIKQFGGDPQQVTLFGESAGGHAVGLHMISPRSQRLFKRAILQSGVPNSLLRSYDVNNDNKNHAQGEGVGSIMLAKRLRCYPESVENDLATSHNSTEDLESATEISTEADASSKDKDDTMILNDESLECMRNKSSLDILKALGMPGNAAFFPTGDDPEGVFTNGQIMDSFDPGSPKIGSQKDYLVGINTDEGTFMLHYGMPSIFPAKSQPKVSSIRELKAVLAEQMEKSDNPVNDSIPKPGPGIGGGAQKRLYGPLLRTSTSVLESFMPKSQRSLSNDSTNGPELNEYGEFGKNVGSLITDIIFLCPARSFAKTLSSAERNVYFYIYTHRSSMSQYHDWIGVTHHDEVEFVFGRPLRLADSYTGKDIEMSQRMIKTWSHFAYTGRMLDQLDVKWPKYGGDDGNYMVLSPDRASVGQRYHDIFCNVYDTIIAVHLQDG